MREPDSHGDPLDAMTGAIKIYKHILKEIDLFWKDAAAGAIIQDQPILSRLLNELPAAGAHIDLVGFTPMYQCCHLEHSAGSLTDSWKSSASTRTSASDTLCSRTAWRISIGSSDSTTRANLEQRKVFSRK